MLKKIAFLFIAALVISGQLDAAGVRHSRSGKILAAEISLGDVKIANLAPYHFPDLPISKAYAVVSVELGDMRVISIFDYTLNVYGVDYPCVAVWRNGRYEYFNGDIKEKGIQQLLFVIDAKVATTQGTIDILLKNNYHSSGGKYDMILPFSIIGKRLPTAPGRIPATGLLELPEE